MAISGKKTDKHFKQSSSGVGERFPTPAIQDNFGHYKATGGETEISASDFQGNVSWDAKSWEQITLISSVGGMLMPNSSTLGENDFDASTPGTIKFGTALQADEIIFFKGHKIWHNGVQVVNQSFKRKDFTVPAGSTQQTFELPFQLPLSYFNGAERSPVYLVFAEGFSRPLERKENNDEANSGDYTEVAISGTDKFNKIKLDSAIGDPSVDTHLTVWVGGSYNSGDLDSAQIVENATLKDPTAMSDETATKLGYREYSVAAGDFTLTGEALTVDVVSNAIIIPYQTRAGNWRIRLNIDFTFTTSGTTLDFFISGIQFKTGTNQALSNQIARDSEAGAIGASNEVFIRSDTSKGFARVSGDVELDSKPTWAS